MGRDGMADSVDIREALGLRPVINCAGTMTSLGASIAVPDAIDAVTRILPQWTEMADLQRCASRVIAQVTGAQAGFVTASSSAGLTLSVAAAMTGCDLAAVERLPNTTGLANEVLLLAGHNVSYGAPVTQAIALAGARPVLVGQATSASAYQLEGAITDRTSSVLFVVSHHVVHYGQIPLQTVCEIAHARAIPVIVDAASEYDLTGFIKGGADLVLYSGHKFLGGPTSGIIAGRKDLIAACYQQNRGIGRGMKVGKEGIAGVIAALHAWQRRDHAAIRARESAILAVWQDRLAGFAGVEARISPDPTGNPLDRLTVTIDPHVARVTAWDLADRLAAGTPPVMVRDDEIDLGYFQLDPCNLHHGEEVIVADRIAAELEAARGDNAPSPMCFAEWSLRRERAALAWPD